LEWPAVSGHTFNQRAAHMVETCGARPIRSNGMNQEVVIEKLFHLLVSGERDSARTLVNEVLEMDVSHEELTMSVYWPVMEMVDTLYRNDQMTTLSHRYATRLLRSLVDQAQAGYERKERRNRKICAFCGPTEGDELSAQLVADLAEADGFDVFFAGGGIANDEILAEVGQHEPDILLIFAAAPSDCPEIRQLFDTIREIGACPDTQLVVGGGVFNRAPGLAEEIGADLWATAPGELLEVLNAEPARRATEDQRTVGRSRRTSRKAA
jgi:methanogenic corrinoid protein MtbC1